VPDGVLFGSSNAHKQIRQEIIENHKLDAVISMPSGVFKPYAGVSTAVLFFTKTGTGGTDNVWFYDMQADGLTLDDKRAETKDNDIPEIVDHYTYLKSDYFSKMHTADGEVLQVNAIPEELGWDIFNPDTCTHNYSDRTTKSFLVPFADIKANDWDLSISKYKEVVYNEVTYAKPSVIIQDIKTLQEENKQKLLILEELLK
jgi:type I restriction enzyme M protein